MGSSNEQFSQAVPAPAIDPERKVRVGVAVIIQRISDGFIVVGKRKSEHGRGTHSLPGGHLEYGEDAITGGLREVKEETGLELPRDVATEGPYVVCTFSESGKHYVTLFVYVTIPNELELKVMEPEKHETWMWVDPEKIPEPRFPPFQMFITQYGSTL